jgi:hypothetical protein
VLRIFIVLQNSTPSARFELANIGSNGKNANNYTTEDDFNELPSHRGDDTLVGPLG